MTRRDALLIRAFCGWTIYVWVTRIWNILGEDGRSTGFKVVHSVLALISITFAVLVWRAVHRIRGRERADARDE